MRKILYILCLTTIIGVSFQNQIPIFNPVVNRLIGIIMALVMLYTWRNKKLFASIYYSKEIRLWIVFLIWVLLTGSIVAGNKSAMFNMYFYLIQQTALILCITTLVLLYKNVKGVLYFNICLFIIFVSYIIITGQTDVIYYMGEKGGVKFGDISNPNGLAFMFLGAVMALFALFPDDKVKGRRVRQLIRISLILLACYFILQTGSRKTAVALLLFIVCWYAFCILPKTNILKSRRGMVTFATSILGVLLLFNTVIPYALNNTYFGIRYAKLQTGADGSALTRELLYQEAGEFFIESPIYGLGLDQFRYNSITGLYAHSDYAEILADTGIIGALIYFPIYIILAYRLWIIRKQYSITSPTWYMSGCLLAMLAAQLSINFGSVGYSSLSNWLVISPIIGFVTLYYIKPRRAKSSAWAA
jgi:O-antigen ligase